MLIALLAICFISVLGNVILASKQKQDPYEWILLSLLIGPLSLPIQYFSARPSNGNP